MMMRKIQLLRLLLSTVCFVFVLGKPLSKPYIAYRTSSIDNDIEKHYDAPIIVGGSHSQRATLYDEGGTTLDLHFTVGQAKHSHYHERIVTAPVLANVFPSQQNQQVIYHSLREHLHVLTTSDSELLTEPPPYPLLLESSIFATTSPLVLDANADGRLDIVTSDYDGGLSVLGINNYRHHFQVPRLYVRKHWYEGITGTTTAEEKTTDNTTTTKVDDPFHSYFEYSYSENHQNLIRGESAHVLSQDAKQFQQVTQRRQTASQKRASRRLLQEEPQHRRLEDIPKEEGEEQHQEDDAHEFHKFVEEQHQLHDDFGIPELDEIDPGVDDMMLSHQHEPDAAAAAAAVANDYPMMDDYRPPMDDGYGRYRYGDDMYGGRDYGHSEYYDNKHYIRLPPHLLTTPVVAEIPKLYGTAEENDHMIIVAVSYYLDEDEYEGSLDYKRFENTDQYDETEVQRGMYVASGIMGYILTDYGGRWTGQTHLELSTDYSAPENVTVVGNLPVVSDTSNKIAMCLSSPTVADLEGDGTPEVIVGTSMGRIYAFDARNFVEKANWKIQVDFPIEQRILVEDVVGNTNLEVFVADTGGNILCLDASGSKLWHRNLVSSLDLKDPVVIRATSPMILGDINGDGALDLVQVVFVNHRTFVFALQASNGLNLPPFPMELDGTPQFWNHNNDDDNNNNSLHQKLVMPILVDLHEDQTSVGKEYLHRKLGQSVTSNGLHILVPLSEDLYILDGARAATQKLNIGETIASLAVDDIHNTGKLDILIATTSSKIITLESEGASYHPLNTWKNGELRGPGANQHAHGASASMGIFVHDISKFSAIQGVYVPVTFEIFDNRPNIHQEPDRQKYRVEIRDGDHSKRVLFRETYNTTGTFTERVYIRYGPGYYNLFVVLQSTHGMFYSDSLLVEYNIGFLDGLGLLLYLPLFLAGLAIVVCQSTRPDNWEEDDGTHRRDHNTQGILGRALPS